MGAALLLPGAKVNRAAFLRSQLKAHCGNDLVSKAIADRPATAGIPGDVIEDLANACIRSHVLKASAISFFAGIPGGWAMLATVPGDIAQFVWHAIVLSQKLAYLYGWQDLLKEGEVDEQTGQILTLFCGLMMGSSLAADAIGFGAQRVALEVAKRLPQVALTKHAFYPMVKQVARWLGVSLTKQSFAKSISKLVPIVGGLLSGTVTAATMTPMAHRLKNRFGELYLAKSG